MTNTTTDPATAPDTTPQSPEASMGPEESQRQITLDDRNAHTTYSSRCLIAATPEEFVVDFVREVRPPGPNKNTILNVESKVIMSPWAAKRLAFDLVRMVRNYEGTFGELETDPRKRATADATNAPTQD